MKQSDAYYARLAIDYILEKESSAVSLTDACQHKIDNTPRKNDKIRSFRMQKQFGARKFIKP